MSNNVAHLFPNARTAAFDCGAFIVERLQDALAKREQATLAVSGGNTPKLLFEYLRGVEFPWAKLLLFFVDERAVPPNDSDSNFRLANKNFLEPVAFPRENVVSVHGEIPYRTAAEEYSKAIRERLHLVEGELPVFDVVHLGMGPDGHTASLFPGDPVLADRTGIAAPVIGKKMPPERVTLLPGVLLAARSAVFLLDGADKQKALNEVLTGAEDVQKYPAQIVARSGQRVDWFLAGLHWPEGA